LDQEGEDGTEDSAVLQAAGILYITDGKSLLLKRADDAADYPGTWAFPAGHMESGESPLLAALRESMEEVGFAPESATPLSNTDGFALFVVRDAQFTPILNNESTGYVWAPVGDLPQPLHPGVAEAIQAAQIVGAMDRREIDTNGWPEIKDNPISKVGVFDYRGAQLTVPNHQRDAVTLDPDKMYRVYRPAAELGSNETVNSFKLLPWIDNHAMLGREEDGLTRPEEKGVQGVIGEDVYFDHPTLFGNLKLFSSAMADSIEAGKKDLSCGYRCDYDWTPGTFEGQPYDCVQRNIRGNHVALVNQGRMGPEVAVMDHSDVGCTGCFVFTCDSKLGINTMADTSTNTPEGGGTSGMTLEEAREKFNAIVEQIDGILPTLAALKGALGTEEGAQDLSKDPPPMSNPGEGEVLDADEYADPENKKYPLRTDEEIRAAWDYIHVKKDGDEFSPEQRKAIEDKIVAAWKDKIDKAGPPEAKAKDADIKPEPKPEAMDEATLFRKFQSQIAGRDRLMSEVAPHIGTFDASEMDETQVATYAVRKLGLKAPKGQEMAYLRGYLSAAKTPVQKATVTGAMDSGGWLDKQRAALTN